MGRGDDANAALNAFRIGKLGTAYMSPTTFYFESGGRNPVIETPLSAATALAQFSLQSWGGKLRVFPAVPAAWRDVAFADLRGEGGFLISARREDGLTRWVSIESLAGKHCIVKVADWKGALDVKAARSIPAKETAPGEYELDLKAGETALLCPAGKATVATVAAIPHPATELNLYGVKKGGQLPAGHFYSDKLPGK